MTLRCCDPYCQAEGTIHIVVGSVETVAAARYTGASFCCQIHMVQYLMAEPDFARNNS